MDRCGNHITTHPTTPIDPVWLPSGTPPKHPVPEFGGFVMGFGADPYTVQIVTTRAGVHESG
jgi:hypothetical protein